MVNDAIESGNINQVTEGLQKITESEINLSQDEVKQIMQTLSGSLELLENSPLEKTELSSAIVQSIEIIKRSEPDSLSENEKSEVIEIIEAVSMTLKEGENITTFSILAESILPTKEEVALNAPEAIPESDLPIKLNFGTLHGQRANVAVMNESYKDILPNPSEDQATIGSPIVSVNFVALPGKIGYETSFSLIFQQQASPQPSGYRTKRQCVYLNTTTNEWLDNGCKTILNDDRTCTCTCSHTTSFAVLLSPTKIEDHRTQEIFSYVMFVINLVFLCLTFCLIAPFKKLRKKEMTMIQLSLIVTLILGYVSFIVVSGSTKITVDNSGNPLLSLNAGCVAGVVISQYFFLSAFFWMGCTAWTFFNKIARAVKNYGKTDKYYFHKCAAISWICPIIFPVASLLFSLIPDNYTKPYVGAEKLNGTNCWVEDPWRFIGFLAPAYLILLFNCICFGMVVKVIISSKKPGSGDLRKTAKAMMVVSVSVGIPWVVAGLAVGSAANFMQFLFIVLAGLQGPILFVALIIFQADAKVHTLQMIRICFPKKKTSEHPDTCFNTYSTSPSQKPADCKMKGINENKEQIYAEIYEDSEQQISRGE